MDAKITALNINAFNEAFYQRQHQWLISQIYPPVIDKQRTKEKEEGETTMTYDHTQVQQQHFRGRLNNLHTEKVSELEHHFGLRDDDPPRTAAEAFKRIREGKVKEIEDCPQWYTWTDQFRWRDPEKKSDAEGFHAAQTKLGKEFTKALNHVIGKPEKALDAVEAFEKVTVH